MKTGVTVIVFIIVAVCCGSALDLGATEILSRDQLKNVTGGNAASGSGCYTCKEKGEVVYDYGDCSTNSSCDANTCSTYSC